MQDLGHGERHGRGTVDDDAGEGADGTLEHARREHGAAAVAVEDLIDQRVLTDHASASGIEHDHCFSQCFGGVEGDVVVFDDLGDGAIPVYQDPETKCEHGGSPCGMFAVSRSQTPSWVNIQICIQTYKPDHLHQRRASRLRCFLLFR
jgi:hypothetical protein